MLSGVSTICFAASYAVALALEISRLLFRSGVRRAVMLGFAGAGLVAHTAFLYYRALDAVHRAAAPLSSEKDWYLVAAWGLVVVYLYFALGHPKAPFGLFLLPLSLGMIAAGTFLANSQPLAREPALRIWGAIHGISLVLTALAVLIGFAAGLMYLGQVRHLKHRIVSRRSLRLPSLEWLEWTSHRAIIVSLLTLGLGVLSGMILDWIDVRHGAARLVWSDPLVIATWLMFFWLLAAAILGAVYRPARQGRKVAYLAIASFVFLLIVLAAGLSVESRHWGREKKGEGRGERGEARSSSRSHALRGNGLSATLCVARSDAERREKWVPTQSVGTRTSPLSPLPSPFTLRPSPPPSPFTFHPSPPPPC
jgi:ABC-type uncharacterized transport system permease subunit